MTREEEDALVRATLRILGNWKVDDAQACRMLGIGDVGPLKTWCQSGSGEIPADLLDRMTLILTIHASLRIWFRDPARGYGWMHRPNLVFAGRSPIELMTTGGRAALLRLKTYLDAELQAW